MIWDWGPKFILNACYSLKLKGEISKDIKTLEILSLENL